MTAIADDWFKYPPNVPYVFYGFSGALSATLICLWITETRGWRNAAVRFVETLGRNSLFTFNLQYVLLFSVAGMALGLTKRQTLPGSLALALLVALVCILAAAGWDALKRRNRAA
jgi:fucose 4-O-acetylase-like acetyltransferase